MRISRRDFLKMGCISAGALMSASLMGCSSQPSSANDNATTNEEVENMEANTENAAAVAATSTAAGTTGVAYFSCTGNTQSVAEKIAAATDGQLMRIEPEQPYTSADLDYNSDCRANTEQNSGTARPQIAPPIPDVSGFDTVYLGYPIWWGKAPRIILTYLEDVDLAGKVVVPFCTSGSSPITESIAELRNAAPGANWLEGRRFPASVSQQEIDSWVSSL